MAIDLDPLAVLSFVAKGHLRLAPCVRVTVYLDAIEPAEVTEYCDAALTLLWPRLTSYQSGSMARRAAVTDKAHGIVASWFRQPREGQTYDAEFTGAGKEGTSPAELRIIVNYNAPKILSPDEIETRRERTRVLYEERGVKSTGPVSEITLTMPLDMEAAHPEPVRRWLLDRPLIAETAFASGHAGLGVNRDGLLADNELSAEINGRLAYAVVRHPGLDWQKNPILNQLMRYDSRTRDLVPQIKRVNWLTLTSGPDTYIARPRRGDHRSDRLRSRRRYPSASPRAVGAFPRRAHTPGVSARIAPLSSSSCPRRTPFRAESPKQSIRFLFETGANSAYRSGPI